MARVAVGAQALLNEGKQKMFLKLTSHSCLIDPCCYSPELQLCLWWGLMPGCPQSPQPPRHSCRCYLWAMQLMSVPLTSLTQWKPERLQRTITKHTHESSLAFLLHEEELSPVSGSRLHPKHHQVAQGQYPQERREEELTEGAFTVAWWGQTGRLHTWIMITHTV